jgi:hypothetical protein
LGVFTLATISLGTQTGMTVFPIIGACLSVALATLWVTVATRTLIGAYHGHLFADPSLAGGTTLHTAPVHPAALNTCPN